LRFRIDFVVEEPMIASAIPGLSGISSLEPSAAIGLECIRLPGDPSGLALSKTISLSNPTVPTTLSASFLVETSYPALTIEVLFSS
jgi:hypothetical protein